MFLVTLTFALVLGCEILIILEIVPCLEAGVMTLWFRVFIAFAADLRLVLSTHIRQLTTAYNSSSKEKIPFGELHTQSIHKIIQAYIHDGNK